MNRFNVRSMFAMIATTTATVTLGYQPEAPVSVDVSRLPTHIADQVRAHAAEGLTSLRLYLDRTRFMHQLRIEDVIVKQSAAQMVKEESGKVKKEEAQVAKRDQK